MSNAWQAGGMHVVFLDSIRRLGHPWRVVFARVALATLAVLAACTPSSLARAQSAAPGPSASGAAAVAPDHEAPRVDPGADAPVDLSEPPATAVPEPSVSWRTAPAERRCGFTFGLSIGGMLGEAEGFPNDARKIDRLAYYTQTGVAGGGQLGNWFGIAMADWFVFGLGGHYGALYSGELRTTFGGGDFHIDVFPAYLLGGPWRELGLTLEAGVSVSTTTQTDATATQLIQSGGASRVGAGVFYEGFRLWKLSMGPFASFDQIWSSSAYRPTAWIGWRTALYVGPYADATTKRSAGD